MTARCQENFNHEQCYQDYLEIYLDGGHMNLKVGVTDITTDKIHAELKCWGQWKSAVGQLKVYCFEEHREELHLYLFVHCHKGRKTVYINAIVAMDIKPYEMIDTDNGFDIIDLQTGLKIDCILTDKKVRQTPNDKMIKAIETSAAPDEFIAELNRLLNVPTGTFAIDLHDVTRLLVCGKRELVLTLKRSYIQDVDYSMKKAPNPKKIKGVRSSNYYILVMITKCCFQQICMLSRGKNAEFVRRYIAT